jgi:hypothetical protein
MRSFVLAALLVGAVPVAAQAAPANKPKAEEKGTTEDKGKSATPNPSDFDFAKMMGMFENIFPAGPEPDPARLTLAKTTANGVLPNGTYAALFDEFMGGMVDRVLAMKPGDFLPAKDKAKGNASLSLHDQLKKEDPYFDERMTIMRRVIGEELIKISAVMEPKLREGLARSIARRFDERQLKEINLFLATDSGKAFAGQTMRMWIDPDVMRSMMQSMPHMISAMPGAMMRIEAETAHLPKPKKAEKKDEKAEAEPTT